MSHSAASNLGLHCSLRPVCLDTQLYYTTKIYTVAEEHEIIYLRNAFSDSLKY